MQNLLAARFQLKIHRETKEAPVYELRIGKHGPKLKAALPDAPAGGFVSATANGLHTETKNGTMDKLAAQLSVSARRPVINRTGLAGNHEYPLDWFPADVIPSLDSNVPSMFAAIEQQLGLKLVSTEAPQDILVIDFVERPSPN